MRYYKSACEFDDTRVQDDYSVIGSEFCDFLATVITFRLLKAFDQAKLLDKMTYKKIMFIMKRIKKVKIEGGNWQFIKITPSYVDVMQKLGLVDEATEKKKPGRPKKGSV